jgi:L-lactate utilization protein LutB
MITTPSDHKTYKKDLKRALQNQFLGATLDTFATAFKASRQKAFEGIDLDTLIAEIAQGKDEAIPCLEELFTAFKARAEAPESRCTLRMPLKPTPSLLILPRPTR